MNDDKLGRGAFFYMTAVTVFNVGNVLYNYFFVDPVQFQQSYQRAGDAPGPLEYSALVNICLNLVFLFWSSSLAKGWGRTLSAFFITVLIAFVAEGLGVHYGYVFGHYHYSGILGVQVWAVPIIVCMAWEPILYAAYCLTDFLIPSDLKKSGSFVRRIFPYLIMAAFGGMATTAWDLMIDPFAVDQGWWIWEQGGPYTPYIATGVPISNFFGWWKVAFVCHLVYRLILETHPKPRRSLYLSVYGPLMLYLHLFLGALSSMLLFLKRPEVAMIGVMCMGGFLVLAFGKIFLLKQRVAPHPADRWLAGEAGEPAAEISREHGRAVG
ncbi:MAG: carotenoid biosynthesis protein [bacterium]